MTLPHRVSVPGLSGQRFRVRYLLTGTKAEAQAKASDICIEQTVEFPAQLVPEGDIQDHIVGRVETFDEVGERHFEATISYAVETAGADLLQLLNVVLGLSSLQPGIRVQRLELPDDLLALYRGPRFGIAGLRELLGVPERPLLSTAIKPMGLSAQDLAEMAYRCALGGMDIIKDDHGITDQVFCRFEERVVRCAEAVARANRETGLRCLYAANITAPTEQVVGRALFAREAGAGALLVSPALAGLDIMRQLADDDRVALPILGHPTLSGCFVPGPESGFSHYVYFGQLHRLAGADASIYVNYGGRFPVSREDCRDIRDGCRDALGHLRPIFPVPGGGMTFERLPELREMYGSEVIFLMGGGLHTAGDDLIENVRHFVRMVQ